MPSTGLSLYELHNAEQNHDQKQYFYSSCGTTLFWYVSSLKEMIGIAGGCFVDSPLPLPPISLNHSQKCDWLLFDESCKAVK